MASVRHAWLYQCVVCATRKLLKLSPDVYDPGREKCIPSHGGVYGGVLRSLR
jgi:hypothetical protein